MKSYVMTDVGRKRASNQDAFCCARLDNGVEFVVLCDGMGGHRGGNVASELAVRGFRELLAACMTPPLTSVRMPAREMGMQAAMAMDFLLHSPSVQTVKIQMKSELSVRESTCAWKGKL